MYNAHKPIYSATGRLAATMGLVKNRKPRGVASVGAPPRTQALGPVVKTVDNHGTAAWCGLVPRYCVLPLELSR